jgi:hypothetical protein
MAASWNTVKYTGFDAFDSIALDTTNKLVYTSTGTTVLQWDPATGTRTDLGTPRANASVVVTFFKGFPYAIWSRSSPSNEVGISKYSSGAWSIVYQVTAFFISSVVGNTYIINIDDSTLVAMMPMINAGQGPNGFYRTAYSSDGSNWIQGTLAGDVDGYAAPVALPSILDYTFGFLTQQTSPGYFIGSENPTLGSSNCNIYIWTGGNWQAHVAAFTTTGATATKRVQSRGLDKWWKEDVGDHYYSNVLTGGWSLAPDESIRFSGGQFNLAKTPGVRRAATTFKWWDNAALDWDDDTLAEAWLVTYGPSRFIFRFNDNVAYMITRNNTSGIVYLLARSEALDGPTWPPTPASGNRTWIYKTTDGGDSWSSRGVQT